MKSFVVCTNKYYFVETVLVSTHNIGCGREIMDWECHHSLSHILSSVLNSGKKRDINDIGITIHLKSIIPFNPMHDNKA